MKILKFLTDLINGKYPQKKKVKFKPIPKNSPVTVPKPVTVDIPHHLQGAKPILSIEVEMSLDPEEGSILDKPDYKELIENNKRLRELHRIQYERNKNGMEAEKNGDLETAIRYFEENVADNFDGSFPYDSLIKIYRDRNDINNAIRVVKKAIDMYSNLPPARHFDNVKLARYQAIYEKLN
ncbi:MAG: hypothetical protein J0L60_06780 [Ignavibacteria bacterium]|nr:hypothetical protein [Ignavibacteria bacterium]